MKKYTVVILVLILIALALGVGFYFKNNILGVYNKAAKNLQTFGKTDLGNVAAAVKKEISAPLPLNIGGQSNSIVLVKSKIIAQTNIQRFDNGNLPPLIENVKLDAAATAKAQDLFKNQYFEHVSPSGVDPGMLAKSFGYEYIVEGENLILGNFASEQIVVQDWMNSPGHRANILNNRFTDIGVSIMKGTYKGQTVWIGVQEFGLPLSACTQADVGLENQINADKSSLDSLSLQIDSQKAEIDKDSPNAHDYNSLVDAYNATVDQYNSIAKETKDLITDYNNQINNFNQCVAGN